MKDPAMKTSATNRRLRVLLTSISNETLLPQPDFQRRLVWSNKDKVAFVKTVLEGYPFPEVYIAAGRVDPTTGEGTELLVDGQQRLTTLHQYFKDSTDLRLPPEVKRYAELEEYEQIQFLEYEVVVRDLGQKPIEEVKEIFQRINATNYGLNAMEIANARYGGEFKEFGEELSQHSFFDDRKIFTATDIKRMNDVRYCLILAATLMGTYFNRDADLVDYLEKYNETFPERDKLALEVDETLEVIGRLNFSRDSRAFKKADFFTLFVELHRIQFIETKPIDLVETGRSIRALYDRVESASLGGVSEEDDAMQYYKAALQASNDRRNRMTRGKITRKYVVLD